MGLVFGSPSPRALQEKIKRDASLLKTATGSRPFGELDDDLAFNFFVTAGHMADWLRKYSNRNDDAIPSAEITKLKDNRIVRICTDISNANKHLELDLSRPQYKKEPPIATDIYVAPAAVLGRLMLGRSVLGQGQDRMAIVDSSGEHHDLWQLIDQVVQLYEDFLCRYGI